MKLTLYQEYLRILQLYVYQTLYQVCCRESHSVLVETFVLHFHFQVNFLLQLSRDHLLIRTMCVNIIVICNAACTQVLSW